MNRGNDLGSWPLVMLAALCYVELVLWCCCLWCASIAQRYTYVLQYSCTPLIYRVLSCCCRCQTHALSVQLQFRNFKQFTFWIDKSLCWTLFLTVMENSLLLSFPCTKKVSISFCLRDRKISIIFFLSDGRVSIRGLKIFFSLQGLKIFHSWS